MGQLFYTEHDIIFKPEVLGVWTQENSPETWEFQRRDAKSYRLVYTDREQHTSSFIAKLADVGGTQFLDLLPAEIEDATPGKSSTASSTRPTSSRTAGQPLMT